MELLWTDRFVISFVNDIQSLVFSIRLQTVPTIVLIVFTMTYASVLGCSGK